MISDFPAFYFKIRFDRSKHFALKVVVKVAKSEIKTLESHRQQHLLDFITVKVLHHIHHIPSHHPMINQMLSTPRTDWTIIHRRFGHIGDSTLARMCRANKIPGLPTTFPTKYHLHSKCWICAQGHMRATPRGEVIDTSSYDPGELIHMDFAFMNEKSIRDFASILLIIDAKT